MNICVFVEAYEISSKGVRLWSQALLWSWSGEGLRGHSSQSICTICRGQVSRHRDALASNRAPRSYVARGSEAAQTSKPGFLILIRAVNFVNCTVKGDLRKQKKLKSVARESSKKFLESNSGVEVEDHEDDVAHCAVAKRAKVQMELQHLEEGSEDKSIVVQHDCAHMVSSDFVECSTATSFDASLHHIYMYK